MPSVPNLFCQAALEFKHALNELDEEVSELAEQTQHLEHYTVDSLSLEVKAHTSCISCDMSFAY
jgi:hypothetical protein